MGNRNGASKNPRGGGGGVKWRGGRGGDPSPRTFLLAPFLLPKQNPETNGNASVFDVTGEQTVINK